MKKVVALILIIPIILTGCWDLVDPEKLGLVTLIGIDSAKDGQIRIVIHEMSQQEQTSGTQMGGTGGGSSVKLHEATASTISEAVQKIAASDFRRTYFAHARAIILSEELVSSIGITPLIDLLERTPEIRRTVWLLITKKGQFDKILSVSTSIESSADTGKIIEGIIKNRPALFFTANTLNDFLDLFWETGSEPYTSGISLIEITAGKAKQGEGTKLDEHNIYDLIIENTAAFKKDKLAGWMDNEESTGLSWATNNIMLGDLIVKFNDKDVALRIVSTGSSIKPSMVNEKMIINIHVDVVSDIIESQVNVDFEQNETINKLQDLQAEKIKKQILAALEK
jgi:spore germination protein KC